MEFDTPGFVAHILSQPEPDLARVVVVLACEVDNQASNGEDVEEVGLVLEECLPDRAQMARVLAVALRNIKPPGRSRNGNGIRGF
jgi:hypothetical protein